MKPIEAGCKAVVINSLAGNNGKIVDVGSYLGDVVYHDITIDGFYHRIADNGKDFWSISPSLVTTTRQLSDYAPEHNLMRIDDPDIQESIESENGIEEFV